jgi:hypothetical protein
MEAKMSGRSGRLVLAASLALAPGALLAQDHAVPRGGGGGGGGSDAGARHAGPSTSGSSPSSGSSSSSSNSNGGYYGQSTAERRHPRAGTGSGSGGYYPGYPIYPGYGWGGYYPGYGGYWWPYGYGYGWYGGYGYGGYPYGGGGAYYSSTSSEGGSVRVLVDPAEARVYVDGYYAGVVDDFDGLFQRLHVSPGRHEITLKLEGYQSHRMRVFVGPDATLKIHHEMQRGNGETFEDLTGGAPPPEREASRERDQDRDRDRDSADVSREEPAPAPDEHGGGRLRLRVQPEDASVYVDGAFRGSSREAGSLLLAPGRHRIEIVRPGYRTAEQEIDVKPGETMPLSITLERPQL